MEIILKKGKVMFCVHCGKNIYRLNRNVLEFERFSWDSLDGIPPIEKPKENTMLNCPYCQTNFCYDILFNFRDDEQGCDN